GPQRIPAFCVEPSRWTEGETGKAFKGNFNVGYAANSVRGASKLLKDQHVVWQNVAQAKAQLMESIGTNDKTSSLNEAQDSDKVAQATGEFLKALRGAIDKQDDLVGMAFAVNGAVQEVNVFPGRSLVNQVYPRLLETYALDAIMQPADKDKPQPQAPAPDAVAALLQSKVKDKVERHEDINKDNRLEVAAAQQAQQGDKSRFYRCLTQYDGQAVHLQWIQGPVSLAEAMRAQQLEFQQRQRGNLNRLLNDVENLLPQQDGLEQNQQGSPVNGLNPAPQQQREDQQTEPQQR
ncbi:MAG: hypothetical protein KDA41_11885, partial [Planctomycetales bacterium]|nr:hypothetical protein [Planctomycetales bacterium]